MGHLHHFASGKFSQKLRRKHYMFKLSIIHTDGQSPWGGMTFASTMVTWWRHQMDTFSALLALFAGNSPVTCEFRSQRPVTRSSGALFICAWINGWVNNDETGDGRIEIFCLNEVDIEKFITLCDQLTHVAISQYDFDNGILNTMTFFNHYCW